MDEMASDEEVQEAILEKLVEAFKDEPGLTLLNVKPLIEDITNGNIAENDVRYNIDRLDSNYAIEHQPTTGGGGHVKLTTQGIMRYEDLTGDEVIPTNDQIEVLSEMEEESRQSPQHPSLSRDDLLNSVSLTEKELDRVIWFLKESRQADVLTHSGRPWWSNASITESGRRLLERHT